LWRSRPPQEGPTFARRRWPFAPAAHWPLAAGISFVDWRLIPFAISIFVVGLAVAFLLGNLRNALQAGLGLALAVGGSATVVYEIPGHTVAMLVFILWGAKIRCALREITDLQAGRDFWHPTRYAGARSARRGDCDRAASPERASRARARDVSTISRRMRP
jgi:hypothetical protein